LTPSGLFSQINTFGALRLHEWWVDEESYAKHPLFKDTFGSARLLAVEKALKDYVLLNTDERLSRNVYLSDRMIAGEDSWLNNMLHFFLPIGVTVHFSPHGLHIVAPLYGVDVTLNSGDVLGRGFTAAQPLTRSCWRYPKYAGLFFDDVIRPDIDITGQTRVADQHITVTYFPKGFLSDILLTGEHHMVTVYGYVQNAMITTLLVRVDDVDPTWKDKLHITYALADGVEASYSNEAMALLRPIMLPYPITLVGHIDVRYREDVVNSDDVLMIPTIQVEEKANSLLLSRGRYTSRCYHNNEVYFEYYASITDIFASLSSDCDTDIERCELPLVSLPCADMDSCGRSNVDPAFMDLCVSMTCCDGNVTPFKDPIKQSKVQAFINDALTAPAVSRVISLPFEYRFDDQVFPMCYNFMDEDSPLIYADLTGPLYAAKSSGRIITCSRIFDIVRELVEHKNRIVLIAPKWIHLHMHTHCTLSNVGATSAYVCCILYMSGITRILLPVLSSTFDSMRFFNMHLVFDATKCVIKTENEQFAVPLNRSSRTIADGDYEVRGYGITNHYAHGQRFVRMILRIINFTPGR